MRTDDLTIGGRRLEAAWWDGAAPAFVLLHEGLGSVRLWRDFPARLAAESGRAVFAWSRRGYGASDPACLPRPMDYMQREAAQVPAVLDAAGIGPCVLVGHSDGASIAALVRDARVRGLVLIAPHYFVEDMCLASIEAAREAFAAGDLRARLARHHRDVDNAFRGWNDAWLDPRFRTEFDIRGRLAEIAVPVLQIQGSADPYGTVAQPAAAEATIAAPERAVPVQTILMPGIRHAPHVEAEAATIAELVAFSAL